MMLIAAIVLLIAAIGFKLAVDYRLWLKEKHINHKKEWWRALVSVLTCSPSIALFTIASGFTWYIALAVSTGLCFFFFWLMFDGIYNKLRRENWWFTGSDDKEDAVTDNFLQAIPLALHIIIKTVPLGILIYLYIKGLP